MAPARCGLSIGVNWCLLSAPPICLLSFQDSGVLASGFGLGSLVGYLVLDLTYWQCFKILLLLILVVSLDAAISLECARLTYFMLLLTFGRGTHLLIWLFSLLLRGPWLLLLLLEIEGELSKAQVFFSPYESVACR